MRLTAESPFAQALRERATPIRGRRVIRYPDFLSARFKPRGQGRREPSSPRRTRLFGQCIMSYLRDFGLKFLIARTFFIILRKVALSRAERVGFDMNYIV